MRFCFASFNLTLYLCTWNNCVDWCAYALVDELCVFPFVGAIRKQFWAKNSAESKVITKTFVYVSFDDSLVHSCSGCLTSHWHARKRCILSRSQSCPPRPPWKYHFSPRTSFYLSTKRRSWEFLPSTVFAAVKTKELLNLLCLYQHLWTKRAENLCDCVFGPL